jgi:F-type H+-transporting ATPase subunit a
MAAGLHISISAEKLFTIAGLDVSNSILTSLIVSGLLIAFAAAVNASLKNTNRPTGLQNIAEFLIEGINNLIMGVTGSQNKTRYFFPVVATFMFFIVGNNWLGLLPGVGTIGMKVKEEGVEHAVLQPSSLTAQTPRVSTVEAATNPEVKSTEGVAVSEEHATTQVENGTEEAHAEEEAAHAEDGVFVPYLRAGTADLNTTIALALITVLATQFMGVKYLGLSYFKKFFNFSDPIMFFVGILELISEFGKILSFAFRLFGNVFAGEVLLVVISALTYVVVPMPFYGLEIFVGFIQGLVFALLSIVFYNMATIGHDDH